MTSRYLLAALSLSVVLTACGEHGRTAASTSTTTTTPAATLQAMLLDAGDVGAGWQIGPEVTDADFADATKLPCPDVAINPTIAKRLTPVAGVQFEPTDHSYRHLIELALKGDPTQLDTDLKALFGAMGSCTAAASTAPGALTVRTLAIPELGDQRAAFILTGTESPDTTTTWYVRDAAVRVGPVAIELALAEILPTPQEAPHISDTEFVKLLDTAVAKLDG